MAIRIARGLNLDFGKAPPAGAEITLLPASVALLGEDYPGLRPVFAVETGAEVRAGDVLFEDRRRPGLRYVAPVSGTVTEIVRGPRRVLDRLVIALGNEEGKAFDIPETLDRRSLVALLLESGTWCGLRTRPFDRAPDWEQPPDAVFVTAIDTRPLAPEPADVIARRVDHFARGLAAIRLLSDGKTYLCHAPGADLPVVAGIEAVAFAGRHPAGLVGTHIHHLHPVGHSDMVWHIGYQDVVAIGHLLATGRLWTRRVIALVGNGLRESALVETAPGADLHDLCRGRLVDGPIRLLSGSPVDGRAERYLARHHLQATSLRHDSGAHPADLLARLAHWLGRGTDAVIPNTIHEQAAPPGVLAIPFLRAISVGDIETARRLGALELAEDDMALLSHVDGGNVDFGALLRRTLDELEAER